MRICAACSSFGTRMTRTWCVSIGWCKTWFVPGWGLGGGKSCRGGDRTCRAAGKVSHGRGGCIARTAGKSSRCGIMSC